MVQGPFTSFYSVPHLYIFWSVVPFTLNPQLMLKLSCRSSWNWSVSMWCLNCLNSDIHKQKHGWISDIFKCCWVRSNVYMHAAVPLSKLAGWSIPGASLLMSRVCPPLGRPQQSSSSDSSGGVSSPESGTLAGTSLCTRGQSNCISQNSLSPQPEDSASSSLQGFHGNGSSSSSTGGGAAGVSYHHINRLLREAHFSSMQIRALPGSTWQRRGPALWPCALPHLTVPGPSEPETAGPAWKPANIGHAESVCLCVCVCVCVCVWCGWMVGLGRPLEIPAFSIAHPL